MEASNIKAIKLYEYALEQIAAKDKEIAELRKRLKVAEDALEKCVNYNNSLELEAAEECDKLPTIREIYMEVGIEVLKCIVCIGCFFSGWYFFSELMDIVFV